MFNIRLHQAFYYAIGLLLMKSVSFVMLPVFTHFLAPEQMGALELLLGVCDLATVLVGFGLIDALYRFVGSENAFKAQEKIVNTVVLIGCTTGFIALVLTFIFAEPIKSLLSSQISILDIQLLAIAFSLDGLIGVPLAWLRMRDQAKKFLLLTSSRALLQALVTWLLLVAGFGITAVMIAAALSATFLALIMIFQLKLSIRDFDYGYALTIVKYATPVLVAALASFALMGADRFAVAAFAGEAELGLYAVAKKLASVTIILMQPFCMWWYAKRFEQLNQPNGRNITSFHCAQGIAITICVAVLICLTAPLIIEYLLDDRFLAAGQYINAMVLFFVIKQIAELANIGSYAGKSTMAVMYIDVFTAVVSLAGFYVFGNIYGIWGVILALLLAQCLRLGLFYFNSQRAVYLRYPIIKLSILFATGLAVTAIGQIADTLEYQLVISIFATLLMAIMLWCSGFFQYKEQL